MSTFDKASPLTGLLCAASALFLLSGCGGGGASSGSVTPIPITPVPMTPTSPPVSSLPTPVPIGVIVAMSALSSDYNGQNKTSLALSHGSAARTTAGGQDIVDLQFSNLGSETSIHFKFVKTGTIQAGDVLPFAPAADGTVSAASEYTETFDSTRRWKADAGSAQVESVSSTGVYTVSLQNVHYTADTATSALGSFDLDGTDGVDFAAP